MGRTSPIRLGDIIELPRHHSYDVLRDGIQCIFDVDYHLLTGWRVHPVVYQTAQLSWLQINHDYKDKVEEVVDAFVRLSPRLPEVEQWAQTNLLQDVGMPRTVTDMLSAMEKYHLPPSWLSREFTAADAQVLLEDWSSGTYQYKLMGVSDPLSCIGHLLPEGFLEKQAVYGEAGMRELLAQSRLTPNVLLNTLIADEDIWVARAARANHLSDAQPGALLQDYHSLISRSEFVEFFDFQEEELARLLEHPQFPLADILGQQPTSKEETLALMVQSRSVPLNLYAASKVDLPIDLALDLAQRSLQFEAAHYIHMKLSRTSKEKPEVLAVLRRSEDASVRRIASQNYLEYLLRQQDFLEPYVVENNYKIPLRELKPYIGKFIPGYDGLPGITIECSLKFFGFHVDENGSAKVYQELKYLSYEYDGEDDDCDFDVPFYAYGEWILGAAVEWLSRDNPKVEFPLRAAFTIYAANSQYDERIISAIMERGELENAVDTWLSDFVTNYDTWWSLVRLVGLLENYSPKVQHSFEQTLIADARFKHGLSRGLERGFGEPWDCQPITRCELQAVLKLARKARWRKIPQAITALLESFAGDILPGSEPKLEQENEYDDE